MKAFWVQIIDLDFFFNISRDVAMAIREKMAYSQLLSLWHSETEWDNTVYMHDLIALLMPLYHVKFWWRLVQ